jgi:uncharacterized membrane protein
VKSRKFSLQQGLPYLLIVAGILGFLSAFIIMYDKVQILNNPGFVPSCNLNPIISCGSVMQSDQANAFGFPNPFIGLAAFPMLATVGAAMLAGARFKRWFWLALNAGLLLGIGFVHWLFFQSVYRIGALCPYCMVVWVSTISSFWYVTLYNIDHKNIVLPFDRIRQAYGWVRRHHFDLLLLWLLVIAGFILKHFWYYYGRYL